MAADSRTLAEATISLPEFARFIGKHVVTVRKWFDGDKKVILTPRGGQRAQMLIPISYALARCEEMNIPKELQQPLLDRHKLRLGKVTTTGNSRPAEADTKPQRPKTKTKSKSR